MGHEAAVTKRKVLGKVEQCVEATNDNLRQTTALTEQHNAFTQEMGTRLHAQATWIQRVEDVNASGRQALERQLAALAEKVSRDITELDTTLALLTRHLIDVKNELAIARARALVFEQLGVFGRLKVCVTGQLPEADLAPVLLDDEQLRGEGILPQYAGAGLSVHDTAEEAQASVDAPKVYDGIQRAAHNASPGSTIRFEGSRPEVALP